MQTETDSASILIKIEQDNQSFFTTVYIKGRALQSERFNTEAAAWMAAEYFEKTYKTKPTL